MRKARGARVKKYHHGTLKSALVEASFQIIHAEGIEALTLRKAAKTAGVTHAAPYSHFSDMADLIAELKQQAFVKLNETLLTALESASEDPFERLRVMGKTFVSFWAKFPEHFEIMFRKPVNKDLSTHPFIRTGQQTFEILHEQVVRACRDPRSRKGLPPELVAVASWSLFQGAIALWMDGPLGYVVAPGTELESLSENLLALWLSLLAAEPREATT